ncbi:MAG: DDE-type integrase/transposase/recombinase [Cenarchaeum sp. SB0666_bin_15]|nr:DDE-type integrase/transposase/recombinase [Cenarchaeum sp. SB0666_bin_15]MYJ27387.1 DDE-type integrase/transposase/recombinase [Cenarchaeum sp. SB0672_bin_9]
MVQGHLHRLCTDIFCLTQVLIRGKRKYLFAMLDSETRYWIAKQVATHKGTDDVRPMFKKARQITGKVPAKLISDGASNFAEAHKDEYAPKNYLWKSSVHESHIRMDGDIHNNQMESFNGNTIRLREKVVRGLKKEDAALLAGLKVYHNHVRPHLGLPDGQTPGEASGIHVNGVNKILTIIRAAAKTRNN